MDNKNDFHDDGYESKEEEIVYFDDDRDTVSVMDSLHKYVSNEENQYTNSETKNEETEYNIHSIYDGYDYHDDGDDYYDDTYDEREYIKKRVKVIIDEVTRKIQEFTR